METHTESSPPIDPRTLPLPERFRHWRRTGGTDGKKLILEDAATILGISVGYISGLERGHETITLNVFRAYHRADPNLFPMTDAGLLL